MPDRPMDESYRLDLPLLRVLAASECWVAPRPWCDRFPLALVFYVTPDLAPHIVPVDPANKAVRIPDHSPDLSLVP